MTTKRTIRKLPERSDEYRGLACSAHACFDQVEYLVSYPQGDSTADRKYCRAHTKGYAKRFGLRPPR